MANTFTLSTILAIAIPLGVVALASILILGIVTFRYAVVANKEKRAYELVLRGDYRRSSLSRHSSRSGGAKRKTKRSCLDIICCIPASSYVVTQSYQGPKLYSSQGEDTIHRSENRISMGNSAIYNANRQNKSQQHQPQHDLATPGLSPLAKTNSEGKNYTTKVVTGAKINDRSMQMPKTTHHQRETTPPTNNIEAESINRNYYFPEFNMVYGSEVHTPESILSVPASPSLKDSIFSTSRPLNGRSFPHPYEQGIREPPGNSQTNSTGVSGVSVSGVLSGNGNSNNLPTPPGIMAPSPPGIMAPSPPRPAIIGRLNSNKSEFEYNDILLQKFPSFASKPRSLTPSTQMYEPFYPAKSELRNKTSSNRFDTNSDELSTSVREYYSASNSLKSADETSNFSLMKLGLRNEQKTSPVQPLNHNTPNRQTSGFSPNSDMNVQSYAKLPTQPKIGESPTKTLAKITEPDDGFAEFFKSPESHVTMTPPPPPPVALYSLSKPSVRRDLGTLEPPTLFGPPIIGDEDINKKNVESQASQSNNSVIDPARILNVLQRNEQIVEGREHIGRTQVTRGHSIVPSYIGSVVQSQTSEAQYTSDLLRTYQLAESMSRASYSSGSKQSTPADKMTNYELSSLNSLNVREDKSNKRLSAKTPEITQHKQFNKSNIQLSSPLSSPGSSYIAPSRNSSLSVKSFGRSRSFLNGNKSLNHFRMKAPNQGEGEEDNEEEYEVEEDENGLDNNHEGRPGGSANSSTNISAVRGLSVIPYAHQNKKDKKNRHVAGHKSRGRDGSDTEGTISKIAALHPPASPRSPGYEPSKGALITSSPLAKVMRKTSTSVKRLSVYSHLKNKHTQALKPQVGLNRLHTASSKGGRQLMSARINKPLPSTPVPLEDGVVGHLHGAKFIATVAYRSRLSDEIDLEVGDVVRVNELFDDNWCRARIVQSSLPTIDRNLRGVCPKACLSSGPI